MPLSNTRCFVLRDDSSLSIDEALITASFAKNCMPNRGGFSPFQMIYGDNHRIKSILTDEIPAMKEFSISKAVSNHLQLLEKLRVSFVKSDSCIRLKRALAQQTLKTKEPVLIGDKVLFSKKDSEWKGPVP